MFKRGNVWWYKFNWNGESIRESSKQSNKRVAEQIEAAHKTSLAKGEVGIRERKQVPSFADFAETDFLPHIRSHFAEKATTRAYYEIQVGHLTSYAPLAKTSLDAITQEIVAGFVEKRREAEYEISSINRALQVLRRMLKLSIEWGKVEKVPPRVSLLPGERRRERVLTAGEERAYLAAARNIGENIEESYRKALEGIRAVLRDERPQEPADPYMLRDVATVLLDCGLRPEEGYRLRWEHVRDNALHIPYGKTTNARRSIPLPARAAAVLEMRRSSASTDWVFPAPTKSGHMEQSTLKKQHAKACQLAEIAGVPFYTFRHTCLTRWAAHMDPYSLAYFAGHSDFATTRRYVHPNLETGRQAMERAQSAQGGHISGHTETEASSTNESNVTVIN